MVQDVSIAKDYCKDGVMVQSDVGLDESFIAYLWHSFIPDHSPYSLQSSFLSIGYHGGIPVSLFKCPDSYTLGIASIRLTVAELKTLKMLVLRHFPPPCPLGIMKCLVFSYQRGFDAP